MNKTFPNQEMFGASTQTERTTFIHKLAIWFRNYLDNAE